MGKGVNALTKVIHGIEGDAYKVKIAPRKSKQPNLEVLKYIKGGKYPEAEVGKYLYAFREGQSRKGKKYVRIKLSVAHDKTWDDWYTTIRGHWMNKGEKHLKICDSDCVESLYFGWLGSSTWQMTFTDDICEVHKRRIRISLGMNSKQCADGSKWSEHKKQPNVINFEC